MWYDVCRRVCDFKIFKYHVHIYTKFLSIMFPVWSIDFLVENEADIVKLAAIELCEYHNDDCVNKSINTSF